MALNLKKSFKKQTSKKAMEDGAWALLAGVTWVILPSILKLQSWTGLATAAIGTFFTGVALDKPALTYSSLALLGTHLLYTKGTGVLNDAGITVWRMADGTSTVPTTPPLIGLRGLSNTYLNPASTVTLPSGNNVMSRPALPPPPATVTTDTMMGLRGYETSDSTIGKTYLNGVGDEVSLLPSGKAKLRA